MYTIEEPKAEAREIETSNAAKNGGLRVMGLVG